MTKPSGDPPRFSGRSRREDPQDIGLLFESAKAAPVVELPRLRWRLRASLRFRATRPRRLLRAVLVAGALLFTGGVVGAVARPYWEHREASPTTPAQPAAKAKSAPHQRALRRPAVAEVVGPAPVPVENETPVPVARRSAPVRSIRSAPPPATANPPTEAPPPLAPPPPSPAAVEQALLGDVVRSLRAHRDPVTALALLDEHAARFPQTVVAPEAGMLRVEALLELGRRGEALSVLDGLPLASLPNRNERLVLRGELRAGAGRWQDARADFERLLAPNDVKSGEVVERALWGRASSRSRLGDEAGARADLAAYLRDFPSGRFAAQAAALLRGSP